jgi:nucleoside-diphosphate-sugar epimerase
LKRVLVTGASGQVGVELVRALRSALGDACVLATDLRGPPEGEGPGDEGPFAVVDCTDRTALDRAAARHRPDTIFHLAAILSAVGEANPERAYQVNMGGLVNVLEFARESGASVFVPSSIAVFGPSSPRDPAPQVSAQRPTTMYGITKVAGELLCDYYHRRFGVDTRGLRYPGLISDAPPGGGTTDWAVEIFEAAAAGRSRYTCFLEPDTQLDMMYMEDATRAAIELMEADPDRLRHRNAYNVTSMQLTPAGLAGALAARIGTFEVDYRVDPVRQAIADSWPRRIDDSAARSEWGWAPRFDLPALLDAMLPSDDTDAHAVTDTTRTP